MREFPCDRPERPRHDAPFDRSALAPRIQARAGLLPGVAGRLLGRRVEEHHHRAHPGSMTPFTQGTVEDRIAFRLRALRLARRRGNTREGAWAASRVRLPGVSLEPADSRFARDARVRFGRALRIARLRRGDEAMAETAVAPPLTRKRSRTARLAVLAVALALFVTTLLLIWTPFNNDDQAAGGGRPLAGGVAPTASPLRGRSDQVVAVVPLQTATPVPDVTDEPSATPAATTAPAGQSAGSTGNTGGGGSGGGSGGGKGTGTGSGTGTA